MEEEILHLYQEPGIGASYTNTYGEENIRNLLKKYHSLDASDMEKMIETVVFPQQLHGCVKKSEN